MNLTHWDPLRDIEDFFSTYQRLWPQRAHESRNLWAPMVDITESEQEYLIKAELPEVAREDIHVDLENGVLTLSGERRQESRDEKQHRVERCYGSFSRSFTLPDNVDAHHIEAEQRDGMLYLHLPKTEPQAPSIKSIEIH